jgi:hypothetical protein
LALRRYSKTWSVCNRMSITLRMSTAQPAFHFHQTPRLVKCKTDPREMEATVIVIVLINSSEIDRRYRSINTRNVKSWVLWAILVENTKPKGACLIVDEERKEKGSKLLGPLLSWIRQVLLLAMSEEQRRNGPSHFLLFSYLTPLLPLLHARLVIVYPL